MATKESKLQIVVDAQNRTQAAFNEIKANLGAVAKTNAGLISSMKTVGTAGAIAFGGLALATKGIVEAGASFEQTQVAFTTMLGSADKARDVLADLAKFAASTPFQLPEVQEASKQLLAYGFSTKELIPTLTELGNVAAGLNIPMSDMTYLFGTLRTQGRAFSKDIYQFTNRGIPIVQELAKVLGVAQDQVMGLVEEGKVGFPEVERAFQNMNSAGGQFNNLMAAQSQTLAGQWSNFKDQITLTSVAIAQQLMPYLKPLLQDLIAVANAVKTFATEHPKLTAAILVGSLALAGLLALLLPIALALPGLIVMFSALAGALGVVTAVSAPMLLAIGAVVTILSVLVANGYATKEAWQDVWLGIKLTVADAANAVISIVEGMINSVIDGVNLAIKALNKVIAAAQKVPGVGKYISKIGQISSVDLGSVDTDLIAKNDLAARNGTAATQVTVTGNVLLSQDVAEQIGDLFMGKLKLSSRF